MYYKKGMYFKKTFNDSYVLGRLIRPVYDNIPLNQPQEWLIEVCENHGYMADAKDENIVLIPSGDPSRHTVKIYKDYSSVMADAL